MSSEVKFKEHIAPEQKIDANKKVNVIGLKDKSAGFYPQVDNLPPNAKEIMKFIMSCNLNLDKFT